MTEIHHSQHTYPEELHYLKTTRLPLPWVLALTGLLSVGGHVQAQETNSPHSAGKMAVAVSAGSLGLGITATTATDFHFRQGDRVQWRAMISGMSLGFEDSSVEISDIEYEDTDYSIKALQLGLDWYPFTSQGWTDEIFFSGGVMYVDSDFSAKADMDKRFIVGNTTVNKGDIESFEQETESSGVLPYVSLGWGNRINGETGFDFMVELGVAYQLSDPDVKLIVVDPNGHLSQADLDKEQEEIKDDADGLQAFGTLTVAYHF